MNRHSFFLTLLSVSVLLTLRVQGQTNADLNIDNSVDNLMIVVTSLDINEEALNLVYEIRNDSEEDAWIFVGGYQLSGGTFGMGAGVYVAEDGRTLTIEMHFKRDSTGGGLMPVFRRFVRLRSGDSQTESIFMAIPANPGPQFGHDGQQEQTIKHATRLAIELGYYRGNLPERILKTLKPLENVFPEDPNNAPLSPDAFNRLNEHLNSREDELLIWEDFSELKREDEQVIRTVIENLKIPYEQNRNYMRKIKSPGLHSYDKIEIQFKPSMLEYFFPYMSQQSLLSPDEMRYLQSDKTIVFNNKQDIHTVAGYIPHSRADTTVLDGIPVRYRSHAEVVCYSAGKPFISFSICNDNEIVIDGKYLISFEGLPSLKKLTPQIQAIDLRTHCAKNLKNQWYRLRFHNLLDALRQNDLSIRNKTLYPRPSEWCDDILRSYPALGISEGRLNPKPHICPSAGKGRNHYAINQNCKPDSPSDMVLLFETKAGWNQNGGPELFTFDNHEPKGGCILLNDGTVKFIRTPEELQRLRWK